MDAQELARRFALGRVVSLSDGPVARGKEGAVWRLETETGEWAVKVPFHPVDEDEVRTSTEFQEAARAAGVPTPSVRRTPEGSVFRTIEDTPVRVYGWVDLGEPDIGLDPALVGTVVAAMHRVSGPAFGDVDPWYREPLGAERWDDLVEDLREAGAPFAGRLAELRDELVALEAWIEPPSRVVTCHRDLWADNVLPTADGGVCIIDWENSGPADPCQELACVLFEFARSDPGRARALTDAYRNAGGPASLVRRGDFSMLIAQLGHITEVAAMDWLRPNVRSPARADSAAWIGEVLDEPHTRDLLDGLLQAVSADRLDGRSPSVRPAVRTDVGAMQELAATAYQMYVERIGRAPAPVTADYGRAVDAGQAWVAELDDRIVGLLVIVPAQDHLLLENVAVAPQAQGRGVGGRLLQLAEDEARTRGLPEVRLYTNEMMEENLAFYPHHGYRETHRATDDGFRRVFFTKALT